MKSYPIILSVDTSCDDTSVAITKGMCVLSNIVASQEQIHKNYGGVMPLIAKLAHNEFINPTYQKALKLAKAKLQNINAVAVTYGPGLAIALEVGIEFAKNLAKELNVPLIAVNHMAGHLYSPLAVNSQKSPKPNFSSNIFPAISLLVSGGHSDLILLNDIKSSKKIGQTIDDAAGECLDKFARLLSLGYPGASAMEQIAQFGNPNKYQFPLPMTESHDLNYSFSGLKTAGRHQIEKLGKLSKKNIEDLSASFQYAVIKALMYKLKKAIKKYSPKSIWIGGGVSNNKELKKVIRKFCRQNNLEFFYPKTKKISSDNAAMIGITAFWQYQKNDFVKDFDSLQRIPRLSL